MLYMVERPELWLKFLLEYPGSTLSLRHHSMRTINEFGGEEPAVGRPQTGAWQKLAEESVQGGLRANEDVIGVSFLCDGTKVEPPAAALP